jgi:hypothetical protein
MRGHAITAEIAGSLMIVLLTGLFTFGGLVFGAYAALDVHPPIQILGLILLLVGVENLPIFLMWCREAAGEMASR